MTRVGVIGAGAWGTTLAALLSARADTTLWAREPEVVESIRATGENQMYLAGCPLPPSLRATSDLQEASADNDVLVFAVPAQHLRAVSARVEARAPIVMNVAKGLEQGSCLRMTEVLGQTMPDQDPGTIGVLSGPNLAREIMSGDPAATCVAFSEEEAARRVQQVLMSDVLRVYTSDDVVGCEVGGAMKNVIAIAAGVADGLGYGTNTRAALITRGLAELARLGTAIGGRPLTFLGLAGNGDLVATCSSPQSRNFRLGRELAAGREVHEVLAGQKAVAEGAETAPVAVELASRYSVDLPIAQAVVALLRGEQTADELVRALMGRAGKTELDGIELPAGA